MVGERRELELAEATERVISWFRIIGGVAGIFLTVTDQIPHPPLERTVEVISLGVLALVGVLTLLWLRQRPDEARLRRMMRFTFAVDAVVLLLEAPLHSFVQLEAPSPALLVPLLGAVRFGRRGAIVGTIGVAGATVLRGLIAVQVYDGPFGVDPAVVTVMLAGIIGGITAHLFDNALAGRARADAARMRADEQAALAATASARAEAVHRVLADGVGGGVGQIVERLAGTVLELADATQVRLAVEGADEGRIVAVAGAQGDEGPGEAHAITYGEVVLGELVVTGPKRLLDDLPEMARQVGLAVNAARLLDHEAALTAKYRALDVMRSNFVTLTSHELRTPLTAIMGASEILALRGDAMAPDQSKELLDVIARQSSRLNGLVDNLVTVGRHDAGSLGLEPRYVTMAEIVDHVAAEMQRPIDIDGDEQVHVWVDLAGGVEVLTNLVDNAFEHGAAPVAVRWCVQEDIVQVSVIDAGSGVPDGQRERVFERFVQLVPIEHHARGTGLGLGISRDLMRAMGGDVFIGPADGPSTFVMELPREAATSRDVEDRRERPRD